MKNRRLLHHYDDSLLIICRLLHPPLHLDYHRLRNHHLPLHLLLLPKAPLRPHDEPLDIERAVRNWLGSYSIYRLKERLIYMILTHRWILMAMCGNRAQRSLTVTGAYLRISIISWMATEWRNAVVALIVGFK